MVLPSKILEQIAFNTRPKIEEHMLIVVYNSVHQEHLSLPLQTNNKQFKTAVTLLNGYNGIFNVTNSNIKFYFKKTITYKNDFIQISIPPGAYEIEGLNNEMKRSIIDKEPFTESDYPFTVKPNFSTLGSILEISPQRPMIGFLFDDGIRNVLGFNETTLYKEYNLLPKPVDILPFDSIFLETDIAQGMIYKGKRSGIIS